MHNTLIKLFDNRFLTLQTGHRIKNRLLVFRLPFNITIGNNDILITSKIDFDKMAAGCEENLVLISLLNSRTVCLLTEF